MNIEVDEFEYIVQLFLRSIWLAKQAPFKRRWIDNLISTPNVNIQILVPSPSGIFQYMKVGCTQAGYF